jgi:hypothetical protein
LERSMRCVSISRQKGIDPAFCLCYNVRVTGVTQAKS